MAVNQTLKTSAGSNIFTGETDPDKNIRRAYVTGGVNRCLSGRRVYDIQGIHYDFALEFEFMDADLFEKLRELFYSGELLYYNDGNVPPLVETGKMAAAVATYNFAGVTNPSGTHIGYTHETNLLPEAKDDFEDNEITTANYQAIDADDSNSIETDDPPISYYLWHKFRFLSGITQANTERLRIKVVGLGDDESIYNVDGVQLQGWNGSSWVLLAEVTGVTKQDIEYTTTEREIAQQFVDPDDSYMRFMARTQGVTRAKGTGVALVAQLYGVYFGGVNRLLEFENKMYACDRSNASPTGRLWLWDGVGTWTVQAAIFSAETYVHDIIVFDGEIYGVTGPNGLLLHWTGSAWEQKAAKIGSETHVYYLLELSNTLYAVTINGKLLSWDGVSVWSDETSDYSGGALQAMALFNGKIYAGGSAGVLLEWDTASDWIEKAPLYAAGYTIEYLHVFNDTLYAITGDAQLLEWNGTNAWVEKAPALASHDGGSELVTFGGELWGVTSSGALKSLLKWNGTNAWIIMAALEGAAISATAMIVFNGKLYIDEESELYQYEGSLPANLNLNTYFAEVAVNEGLGVTINLTHTPILSSGDVIWVKNLTQVTTLALTADYTISGKGVTVTGQATGDVIEVKYNRYFEVKFADLPEDWLRGSPGSDRNRSAVVNLTTQTGGVVDS